MTLQVFVSYKSEYRDFARKVRDQLRGWGYDTWFDMDNIPKGAYFRDAIEDGLSSSDVLVGVITPEAQGSREVMAEVDYFLRHNKPLVLIKHGNFELRYIFFVIQYIDFTTNEAQAFADLQKRLAELSVAETEDEEVFDEKPIGGLPERERQEDLVSEETIAPPPQFQPPPSPAMPSAPITPLEPQPQPALPPLQQVQRKTALTRYLLPAVAVMALVSVGVLAVVSGLGTPNMSATESPQLPWGIPLLAVAVVGGLAVWWLRGRSSSVEPVALEASNRARMLDKVYDFWVVGVLENALQESGAFDLGLAAAPGAVLRHKDYGDYQLPPNAKIIDIFNDLNRELLILGAPGAGKTILLLRLAKALIEEARSGKPLAVSPQLSASAENAIPVVFNLSSWAAERKPLAEWIVDELRLRYQVPKKVAETWIAEQTLLLLLDGLDEVAEQYRDACVDAINDFREQYVAVDVAVCSRIADYELLTNKLDLRGAVTLQPLNDEQIADYIDRPELDGLRQVMTEDTALREMASTPFLLNAMVYAYRGVGANVLENSPEVNIEVRRTRLLNAWVEKRLAKKYEVAQVRHYLAWLADKMVTFGQSVFYIEELQPEWLKDKQLLWYKFCFGILVGIVFVLGFGTAIGVIPNYFTGHRGSLGGLLGGMAIAAPFGLVLVLSLVRNQRLNRIKVIETIHWFWVPSAWSVGEKRVFVVGLLVCGLLVLLNLIVLGFALAVIIVFSYGLITDRNLQIRKKANEGFWQSARNGALIGLLTGLLLGVATGAAFGSDDGLIIGIPLGIVAGIIIGAGFGLFAVAQHIILRILLVLIKAAPWNYARFLDACAKIGLLRKVGGGYIFAHRYLLEYFAGLETSAGK